MSLRPIAATGDIGVYMPISRKTTRGFTLIELMIVVAVIAILAAIAYPSYTDSVLKSRRGQAKADMVEAAQIMERFHTEHNTYVGAKGVPGMLAQSPKTGTARYLLAVSNDTQSTFTLTATPEPNQAKDKCGVLTINQAGVKTPVGSDCW